MTRYLKTGCCLMLALLLAQCHSKKEQLEGVWKLDMMEMNGAQLSGSSLGEWYWEFNDKGGYLTMVAGAQEKGRYTLQGDKLAMKSATNEQRPETHYHIAKLDSAVLQLESLGDKNTIRLFFLKTKGGETGEDD